MAKESVENKGLTGSIRGIRENLYSKGQLVPSKEYRDRYDEIEWSKEEDKDDN
jgi:hypothetical protein